jgi:hypothetical protein
MYFRPTETRRVRAQLRVAKIVLAQCVGKKCYRSEASAVRVVFEMWLKGRGVLTPYECPHCQGWHVGHAHRKDGLDDSNA